MPLSLVHVDELIAARRMLHGGGIGAPKRLTDGTREGAALNRACIVMLSAALQAFVEEVFLQCSFKAFGRILVNDELKLYNKTWDRWGNPSDLNISRLFNRLGVEDVFDGLSWQRKATSSLKTNFNHLNQIRNDIAHGSELMLNNKPYSLRLTEISRWRNTAQAFGERFPRHAIAKIL